MAEDTASGSPADSLDATLLTVPDPGILYVRYGAPGAVQLHRGNLAPWRGRVRSALDSLRTPDAARQAQTGGIVAVAVPTGTSTPSTPSLLSVLDEFGRNRAIHGAGTAIVARPDSRARRQAPTDDAALDTAVADRAGPLRPIVIIEIPAEEQDRDAGGPQLDPPAVTPFAGRVESGADPDEAGRAGVGRGGVIDAGRNDVNLVPILPPITSADPETLRIALTERRVVQTQAILFETARAEILPGAEPILEELAKFLREDEGVRLRVEGHTDVRGSDAYNQELSEARAESIRTWLVRNGIEPDRVSAIGLGEMEPFDTRQTIEAHALNRRVVFRILPLETR